MPGSANLNLMIKAARVAARALIKDFGEVEQLQVSTKGPGDFVSRADRRAEETIRNMLLEGRPSYGFLGEEGGPLEGKDPTRRWIVDPLDGTTNYLHGQPHWAISIALEHKGQVVSAVIYDPVRDELYWAEKGQGAWMNDRRIRVSARRRLTEGLFAAGIPAATQRTLPLALRDLARLVPESAGVRRTGSAALDLAWVAAGRFDGYWERETDAWDVAAGILLVIEAGGLIGTIGASGDPLLSGDVIAANGEIFDSFAKVIRAVEA